MKGYGKKKTKFKKTDEKICYVKYKYKVKKYQKNRLLLRYIKINRSTKHSWSKSF